MVVTTREDSCGSLPSLPSLSTLSTLSNFYSLYSLYLLYNLYLLSNILLYLCLLPVPGFLPCFQLNIVLVV